MWTASLARTNVILDRRSATFAPLGRFRRAPADSNACRAGQAPPRQRVRQGAQPAPPERSHRCRDIQVVNRALPGPIVRKKDLRNARFVRQAAFKAGQVPRIACGAQREPPQVLEPRSVSSRAQATPLGGQLQSPRTARAAIPGMTVRASGRPKPNAVLTVAPA